jgi:hypothetical protein
VSFIKQKEDHSLWIKLDGKLFGSQFPILLCLCYNIPSGSSRESLVIQNIFDSLTDDVICFENQYDNQCHFMLMGDFNARIGEREDFVENEILLNLDILPEEYEPDLYLNRRSQDRVVNENGLDMLDFCKQTGMRVLNGRMFEDESVGKFTCVKSMGSSVVDYVLCRPVFFDYFTNFSVEEPNILSDHSAILFELGTNDFNSDTQEEREITHEIKNKFVWDSNKVDNYKQALQDEDFLCELDILSNSLSHLSKDIDIDDNLSNFYSIFESICNPIFG